MKNWPVQAAKARFSELLRAAGKRPQRITVRGKPAAVLLSDAEYRRLCGELERPKRTFAEWWKSAPRVPKFTLQHQVRRKKPKSLADVLLSAPRVRTFKLPPRV